MEFWSQIILTIFASVLASSGLWAFLSTRFDKRDAEREILLGICHIEIVFFGMHQLHEPYAKLGGNGSGTKIMKEVEKLPIKGGLK